VLVHGESGSGKTALVQAFVAELRTRSDVITLEGRCFERESIPFKALDGVIDALSSALNRVYSGTRPDLPVVHGADLLRLFPVLRRVKALGSAQKSVPHADDQISREFAFSALRDLFEQLSRDATVVLFIDDLQWGDRDSALLLKALFAPQVTARLLLVGVYRSAEAASSPFFAAFNTEQELGRVEATRLELSPLSGQDVAELVRHDLGAHALPSAAIERLASESQGNPFFAGELVRFVAAHPERLADTDRFTLDDVVLARVRDLDGDARRLLELVCVVGHPIGQEVLFGALELGAQGPAALDTLRRARFVRTRWLREGELVEPYHDRIRETLGRALSEELRVGLHRAVAHALEAKRRGEREQLMLHFAAAREPVRAAQYAYEAARLAAESLAFDHAVELYRRGLDPKQASAGAA